MKLIKVNLLPAMLKVVVAGLVRPVIKKENVNKVHVGSLLQSFLNRFSDRPPKNVYLHIH